MFNLDASPNNRPLPQGAEEAAPDSIWAVCPFDGSEREAPSPPLDAADFRPASPPSVDSGLDEGDDVSDNSASDMMDSANGEGPPLWPGESRSRPGSPCYRPCSPQVQVDEEDKNSIVFPRFSRGQQNPDNGLDSEAADAPASSELVDPVKLEPKVEIKEEEYVEPASAVRDPKGPVGSQDYTHKLGWTWPVKSEPAEDMEVDSDSVFMSGSASSSPVLQLQSMQIDHSDAEEGEIVDSDDEGHGAGDVVNGRVNETGEQPEKDSNNNPRDPPIAQSIPVIEGRGRGAIMKTGESILDQRDALMAGLNPEAKEFRPASKPSLGPSRPAYHRQMGIIEGETVQHGSSRDPRLNRNRPQKVVDSTGAASSQTDNTQKSWRTKKTSRNGALWAEIAQTNWPRGSSLWDSNRPHGFAGNQSLSRRGLRQAQRATAAAGEAQSGAKNSFNRATHAFAGIKLDKKLAHVAAVMAAVGPNAKAKGGFRYLPNANRPPCCFSKAPCAIHQLHYFLKRPTPPSSLVEGLQNNIREYLPEFLTFIPLPAQSELDNTDRLIPLLTNYADNMSPGFGSRLLDTLSKFKIRSALPLSNITDPLLRRSPQAIPAINIQPIKLTHFGSPCTSGFQESQELCLLEMRGSPFRSVCAGNPTAIAGGYGQTSHFFEVDVCSADFENLVLHTAKSALVGTKFVNLSISVECLLYETDNQAEQTVTNCGRAAAIMLRCTEGRGLITFVLPPQIHFEGGSWTAARMASRLNTLKVHLNRLISQKDFHKIVVVNLADAMRGLVNICSPQDAFQKVFKKSVISHNGTSVITTQIREGPLQAMSHHVFHQTLAQEGRIKQIAGKLSRGARINWTDLEIPLFGWERAAIPRIISRDIRQ